MDAYLFAASLGAFVGLGALILPWLQSIVVKVAEAALSVVVAEKHLDYSAVGVLVDYLYTNSLSFGRGVEAVGSERTHVRSEGRNRTVFYRLNDKGWQFFLYRGKPVIFAKTKGAETNTWARVWFFRRTIDWDNLLLCAAERADSFRQQKQNTRFVVIHHPRGDTNRQITKTSDGEKAESPENRSWFQPPVGWDPNDLGPPIPDNFLEFLSLGPEAQQVVRDVKFWHTRHEWYKERGLPWRRGILLYGPPGNGKTSLVRALAQHLDMPVHAFDLASMDNEDLINHWTEARTNGDSRIVLLEDIDSVFHGRQNIIKHSKLTFDTLLNVVDGIEQEDGLLLFITTNQVKYIDPAMGVPLANGSTTRPGRLDMAVELPGLDEPGRLKMALRIVKDPVAAQVLVEAGGGDTAVQFQERCMQQALNVLWQEERGVSS